MGSNGYVGIFFEKVKTITIKTAGSCLCPVRYTHDRNKSGTRGGAGNNPWRKACPANHGSTVAYRKPGPVRDAYGGLHCTAAPGPLRSHCNSSRSWCNFLFSRSTRWASCSRVAKARQGENFSPIGAKLTVLALSPVGGCLSGLPSSGILAFLCVACCISRILICLLICSERGILEGTKRQYLHSSGEHLPRRNRHASAPSRNPLSESLRWVCISVANGARPCLTARNLCLVDLITRPVTMQSPEHLSVSPRRRRTFGDLQARSMEGGGGWQYAKGGDLVSASNLQGTAKTSVRAPLPVSAACLAVPMCPCLCSSFHVRLAQHITIAPGRFSRMTPPTRAWAPGTCRALYHPPSRSTEKAASFRKVPGQKDWR